jgi:hypothetical protein
MGLYESSTERRSAAEKARDSAGMVGSLKQEGYVPTPEAEAVHRRVARWEITSEEAIRTFHDRALNQDTELSARNGDRRYQRHLWARCDGSGCTRAWANTGA